MTGQDPQQIKPQPKRELTLEEFEDHVSKQFGIPRGLRESLVGQESGGNSSAVSPKGARGRWQTMPGTVKKYGLDPNNEFDRVYTGARYLKEKYDEVHPDIKDESARWQAALAGYHGGERQIRAINQSGGNVASGNDGGITTAGYADQVMKRWQQWSQQNPPDQSQQPAPAPRLPVSPPPRRPSKPSAGVFAQNKPLQADATAQARNALNIRPPGGTAAQAQEQLNAVNRMAPVDPKLRAQSEAYQAKSLPAQIATDVYQGLARGGQQVQQAAGRVIGAGAGLARKYVSPQATFSPVDVRTQRGQAEQARTAQNLENQQRASGDPILGEVAAALPVAAGATLAGTAGGIPALAAYNAGLEDWQDPKRSAARAALNTVVPIGAARVASRVAAPAISRLASPVARTAANVATETVSGGVTSAAQTAAEQQYFDGRVDPNAVLRSGIVGAGLSGGMAAGHGEARPSQRQQVADIAGRAQDRPGAGGTTITRLPAIQPSTPEAQLQRIAAGSSAAEGAERLRSARQSSGGRLQTGEESATQSTEPLAAAQPQQQASHREVADAAKIEAGKAEQAGNYGAAAAQYDAARQTLVRLRRQSAKTADPQTLADLDAEINLANQGKVRALNQDRANARQQAKVENAPTRGQNIRRQPQNITPEAQNIDATAAQPLPIQTNLEPPQLEQAQVPLNGNVLPSKELPQAKPKTPSAVLSEPTNRITEGAGDELQRYSKPLEGQGIEVPEGQSDKIIQNNVRVESEQERTIARRTQERESALKGNFGKFSEAARRSNEGARTPLARHPELRQLLDLPPVPDRAQDAAGHDTEMQNTLNALAELGGKPRSSELDYDTLRGVYKRVAMKAARRGTPISDDLKQSFKATVGDLLESQKSFGSFITDERVQSAFKVLENGEQSLNRREAAALKAGVQQAAKQHGIAPTFVDSWWKQAKTEASARVVGRATRTTAEGDTGSDRREGEPGLRPVGEAVPEKATGTYGPAEITPKPPTEPVQQAPRAGRGGSESGRAAVPEAKAEVAEQRTVSHSDPAIDGKPVVATTKDGRVIVPNDANQSGVSIVKDQGAKAEASKPMSIEQWGKVTGGTPASRGLYFVDMPYSPEAGRRVGYSQAQGTSKKSKPRDIRMSFEKRETAQAHLEKAYRKALKDGNVPPAPERVHLGEWADEEGNVRPAIGDSEVWPQTAKEKEDKFVRVVFPEGKGGGYIEESRLEHARKQGAKAAEAPSFDTLAQKMREVGGALVSTTELRAAMKDQLPSKEAFDKFLLQQAESGKVALHQHDYVSSLSQAERDGMVVDEKGNHYVGVAMRGQPKAAEGSSATKLKDIADMEAAGAISPEQAKQERAQAAKEKTVAAESKKATIAPEKTNAETTKPTTAPASERRISEPVKTSGHVARGSESTLTVPRSKTQHAIRYEVRELGDIQASHNPFSFEKNPDYRLTNDRDYGSAANRMDVEDASKAGAFDPRLLLTDDPTATNGPPVIYEGGDVLGGNSRTMMLARVYHNHPVDGVKYREAMKQRAAMFGVDPKAIDRFDRPVLVRVIDSKPENLQKLITDLNVQPGKAMTSTEAATARGKNLAPETMKFLGDRLFAEGPDGTLLDALRGQKGIAILDRLIRDGAIPAGERNKYLTDQGEISAVAKSEIEGMMLGRMFDSADQMKATPPAVKNKLARIAPQLAKLSGTEWDITKLIPNALRAAESAKTQHVDLEMLNRRGSLFEGTTRYTPEELALARWFKELGPRQLENKFTEYVSGFEQSEKGAGLFGDPPKQSEIFDDVFKPAREKSDLPKLVADQQRILDELKSGKRSGSGGEALFAQAVVTGHKVYKAGMEFRAWAKEVIKEAGDAVKPHLRAAWQKLNEAGFSVGELKPKTRADVENSPEFKRWFGESKIQKDGKPLVMYHGTTKDFDAFDPKMRGTATKSSDSKKGFFFTDKPEAANAFTTQTIRDAPLTGANVMPVYLKVENPAVWDWGGGQVDADAINKAIRDAKRNGHDGLVLMGARDRGFAPGGMGTRSNHVIVFDPKQIKSATGNSGAFSSETGSILGAGGGGLQNLFGRKKAPEAERRDPNKPYTLAELRAIGNPKLQAEAKSAGRPAAAQVTPAAITPKTTGQKTKENIIGALSLPRALMASADISAPLRQGAILTLPPSQWGRAGRAFVRQIRAFKTSEYNKISQEIANHPDAEVAKKSGLHFATDKMTTGEEDFFSKFAGKIPVVKHSEQAYKAYLDSLRMDTFAKYKAVADKNHSSPEAREAAYKASADWINIATGRGSLGKGFDKIANELGTVFFAPRYTASRIQVLNPVTYLKNSTTAAGRTVLRQQMTDLVQFAGVTAATIALAKAAGATVGTNPNDPDFLKIRHGRVHYDMLAGLQQVMRLFYRTGADMRLAMKGEPAARNQGAFDVLSRFGRSKLAPVPSYFVDAVMRKTYIGEDFNAGKGAVERITPLMFRDYYEAYKQGGFAEAAKMTPGLVGVGTQYHDPSQKRSSSRPSATRRPMRDRFAP